MQRQDGTDAIKDVESPFFPLDVESPFFPLETPQTWSTNGFCSTSTLVYRRLPWLFLPRVGPRLFCSRFAQTKPTKTWLNGAASGHAEVLLSLSHALVMAIFNSYVSHYQRVSGDPQHHFGADAVLTWSAKAMHHASVMTCSLLESAIPVISGCIIYIYIWVWINTY